MKTSLTRLVQQSTWGQEADHILRSCVHCGFCTAVCPTYQLLGNELDGPRGRIYLIKSMLEGNPVTQETQQHLDLCLNCRSCETACPSGVQYGRLADIGKGIIEEQVKRPWSHRLLRWGLRTLLAYPQRFNLILRLGQFFRPILPKALRQQIPQYTPPKGTWPTAKHKRSMIVLEGCVQPGLTPNTNVAAAQVLDKLGINLLRASQAGCCGALDYHLAAHDAGLAHMRKNIDAWWPLIEIGAEAIVITASGCGSLVKEYGHLFRNDSHYAEKAARISALTYDISEILSKEELSPLQPATQSSQKIAVHVPCSLQHGQKLMGTLESLLKRFGFELTPVPDSHLCCGSSGIYSILNKQIAQQLLTNKLRALHSGQPQLIVTANIGCQMYLQTKAEIPVKHWVELIADRLV